MPKFKFFITRQVTESAEVIVEGDDIEDAHTNALTMANDHKIDNWQQDDMQGEPFIPDPGTYTEIGDKSDTPDDIKALLEELDAVVKQDFEWGAGNSPMIRVYAAGWHAEAPAGIHGGTLTGWHEKIEDLWAELREKAPELRKQSEAT
jgi:hypothetical protein